MEKTVIRTYWKYSNTPGITVESSRILWNNASCSLCEFRIYINKLSCPENWNEDVVNFALKLLFSHFRQRRKDPGKDHWELQKLQHWPQQHGWFGENLIDVRFSAGKILSCFMYFSSITAIFFSLYLQLVVTRILVMKPKKKIQFAYWAAMASDEIVVVNLDIIIWTTTF